MTASRLRLRPAQVVALGFVGAIAVGTLLLTLPLARPGPGGASLQDALFTATSSVTVTGLAVVDTATYWSTAGQVVILALVQLGGLGVMSATALLVLLVRRRVGLRSRLAAQTEFSLTEPGDVRRVLRGVLILTLVAEALASLALAIRFWAGGDGIADGAWNGLFLGVMSFNNAGFTLFADSLEGYAGDVWLCGIVALAVIAGGLGVPVWAEVVGRGRRNRRRWSVHTRLTLWASLALIVFGTAAVIAFEWGNPATLGGLAPGDRLVAGVFQGITPRSAGFNSVDYGAMNDETLLVTDFLMFVGAGSVSTGGGIKVTTLCVLVLATVAAVRGAPHVQVFGRRIPDVVQRQALTVTVIAVAAGAVGTLVLVAASGLDLSTALFETLSALGTAGLSTGVTGDIHGVGQAVLISLMIMGRVGPQVLAAALVIRESERLYTYPEERPIVG